MHIPFFNSNNKSPLEQTMAEGNQPIRRNLFSKKTILISAIIAFVILNIVLLFITGLVPSENLPFAQKPSPTPIPDVLLVTVGEQKIFRSDVEKLAKQQYQQHAINNKVLQVFLNTAIERAILNQETKKFQIQVSNTEIDNAVNNQKNKNLNALLKTEAKYTILKQKIIAKFVKSVDAYTIGFWIPPLHYTQIPLYAQQRTEGNRALNEIQLKLEDSEKPYDVTKYIFDKYPILQVNFALNGYIFGKVKNLNVYEKPKTYTFNSTDLKSLDDPEFYNALLAMRAGEIKKVIKTDLSGGVVIQAISVKTTGFSNYKDFLDARIKELVVVKNAL